MAILNGGLASPSLPLSLLGERKPVSRRWSEAVGVRHLIHLPEIGQCTPLRGEQSSPASVTQWSGEQEGRVLGMRGRTQETSQKWSSE